MIGRIPVKFDRMTADGDDLYLSYKVEQGYAFAARQTVAAMRQSIDRGKDVFTLNVAEYRRKRTNNANAYFWALFVRVADRLDTTSDELYRRYIREVGIFQVMKLSPRAVGTFEKVWTAYGTGWFVEVLDVGSETRMAEVKAYYGSSVYTSQQMSRLIDRVVDDCKELGIETLADEDIDELIARWAPDV